VKFHGPSVALGFSSAIIVAIAARRLRPVAVEIAALGLELAKMGRAIVELQRENIEDFWYEVQNRSVVRAQGRRKERARHDENPQPPAKSQS
jgi:hypothetical protein